MELGIDNFLIRVEKNTNIKKLFSNLSNIARWNGSRGSKYRNNYYKTYDIKKFFFHKNSDEKRRKLKVGPTQYSRASEQGKKKLQELQGVMHEEKETITNKIYSNRAIIKRENHFLDCGEIMKEEKRKI